MKFAVYYCKFGSGHYAAAQALNMLLSGSHELKLYDLYEEAWPEISDLIYGCYKGLVRSPQVLSYLGGLTQDDKQDPAYLALLERKMHKVLDKQAKQNPADVYIASYSMAAHFLASYKRHYNQKSKLVICITDFSVHKYWIQDECDLYLVPSEHTKEELLAAGVDGDKILVCSLIQEPNKTKIQDQPRLKILISGGGLGLLPKHSSFYKKISEQFNAQIRVICGGNRELFYKLANSGIKNLEVYAYVDNMKEQLNWADCIIGKPGGLSLMEAIAHEVPIWYLQPKLPQEKGNAQFIEEAGIGAALMPWRSKRIADKLSESLGGQLMNKSRLRAQSYQLRAELPLYQQNMRKIKQESLQEFNLEQALIKHVSQGSW